MTALQLFNTQTRALQEVEGPNVRLYTCGPTVYDYAHIGNFRTFVFEDLLRRTLRFLGYKVDQVMNLTDVDDKTIRGAIAKNVSLDEFTKSYKEAFFSDLAVLNIQRVEHYPEATRYIPQMIDMVNTLLDKDVAYRGSDGSVYFAIKRFAGYGKLSHLNLEDLKAGASERMMQDEYAKESASDFVLWKAYDPARDGSIYWESPFGKGRPGWHLECSVMAQALLGKTIDIHAGGVDLIFPHHENEIAQSECCSGQLFSKLWVHSEHLLVDGKKMSKSLGNFYTLRDLLKKGYSATAIRYLLIATHYRTQLNFTFQGLEAAKSALSRINDNILRLESYQGTKEWPGLADYLVATKSAFTKALQHDLNASEALAVLFEMIREVNAKIDEHSLTTAQAKELLTFLQKLDEVFGICSFTHEKVPEEIQKLADERQKARAAKEFKRSDDLRHELQQKGYLLEDTPTGVRIKKI